MVVDPLEKVMMDESEKFTYISSLLSNEEREHIRLVLLNNASSSLVCLILFPSVGITVVQHCNTVGIHMSFPHGVV